MSTVIKVLNMHRVTIIWLIMSMGTLDSSLLFNKINKELQISSNIIHSKHEVTINIKISSHNYNTEYDVQRFT